MKDALLLAAIAAILFLACSPFLKHNWPKFGLWSLLIIPVTLLVIGLVIKLVETPDEDQDG